MKKIISQFPIKILLVEDNPGDVRLIKEAFKDYKINNIITLAKDGEMAMQILCKEGEYANYDNPDLIMLDLNMPKKNGRELLNEIKLNQTINKIPIIILTTSYSEEDLLKTYDLHANCYITKPLKIVQFLEAITTFEQFWLSLVLLPKET